MITPVILSGGSGTRLWPLSRKLYPKQFISLVNETTLFQDTILRLPEGISERFIQGFSPGSSSGYVVFMDHGEETKYPEIDCYSAPYRGIVMWSFPTLNLDEIFERAVGFGVEILHSPNNYMSPTLTVRRSFVLKDPDGFQIEIFEN